MPILNETNLPPEVKPLFTSAQAGKMSAREFCQALKELGIDEVSTMFYLSKAFGLPWEVAKRVVIEEEYGTVETWANPIIDSVAELDREEN